MCPIQCTIADQCNNPVSTRGVYPPGGRCQRCCRLRSGALIAEEDPESGALFDPILLGQTRPYLVGNQVWLDGGTGSYGAGSGSGRLVSAGIWKGV